MTNKKNNKGCSFIAYLVSAIVILLVFRGCGGEFPESLHNKKLYVSPYFFCSRGYLLVDDDNNFTLVRTGIGNYETADRYTVKGKFISDNEIEWYGTNTANGFTFLDEYEIHEFDTGPHDTNFPIIRLKANFHNTLKGRGDIASFDYALSKSGGCYR